MLLANQTLYLICFIAFIGLMSPFFWVKWEQKGWRLIYFWPLGLGLFSISSLAFYLATWMGKPALAVANLALVAGTLSISLLFTYWNESLSQPKKLFSIIWFLGVAFFYLYLLEQGSTNQRIHLMNVNLGVLLLWQWVVLFYISKKDDAYQIKLLMIVVSLQLLMRIARSVALYSEGNTQIPNLYQEDAVGFSLRAASFLANVIVCILIANYYLEKLVQHSQKAVQSLEDGMLSSLNMLSMVRDNETGNHILRTKNYVKLIADRLRIMQQFKDELSEAAINRMTKAAPLHDIGKIGIPDEILKKDSPLSEDERHIMQTHAELGAKVLEAAKVGDVKNSKILGTAIEIAGSHHERWDGSGYPKGLKGSEIPLAARIMSLADMYDALVSERIYKDRWSHEDAKAEIVRLKGIFFDPVVVEAFLHEQDQFSHIANKYRDDL